MDTDDSNTPVDDRYCPSEDVPSTPAPLKWPYTTNWWSLSSIPTHWSQSPHLLSPDNLHLLESIDIVSLSPENSTFASPSILCPENLMTLWSNASPSPSDALGQCKWGSTCFLWCWGEVWSWSYVPESLCCLSMPEPWFQEPLLWVPDGVVSVQAITVFIPLLCLWQDPWLGWPRFQSASHDMVNQGRGWGLVPFRGSVIVFVGLYN